ncbi:hypothetical protein ACI3LX_003579 [Candidozyma auris]
MNWGTRYSKDLAGFADVLALKYQEAELQGGSFSVGSLLVGSRRGGCCTLFGEIRGVEYGEVIGKMI